MFPVKAFFCMMALLSSNYVDATCYKIMKKQSEDKIVRLEAELNELKANQAIKLLHGVCRRGNSRLETSWSYTRTAILSKGAL
jgi:hypothetical protein